ncbi:MAG: N-acetyltransferase [Anaerolineales bacterium]|nr:N-acetyltransferase [Anaerolineales bacterium]
MIRPEMPADNKAIEEVTLAAFTGLFTDNPTEHLIVNSLRKAGALSLSLVAEMDKGIVGHVAFSIVTIDEVDKGWYGLGPVSVLPAYQKQGFGSALIKEGLTQLRAVGAKGCVVLGSPQYYQRFGFRSNSELVLEGTPAPEYFMALPFDGKVPNGKVEYNKAFYVHA